MLEQQRERHFNLMNSKGTSSLLCFLQLNYDKSLLSSVLGKRPREDITATKAQDYANEYLEHAKNAGTGLYLKEHAQVLLTKLTVFDTSDNQDSI